MVMQHHIQPHCHKVVPAVHVAILRSVQIARQGVVGENYRLSPKKTDLYLAGEPNLPVKAQKGSGGIPLFFL